eukprot:jgi/Chrzof1/2039/UNPLg00695.t1
MVRKCALCDRTQVTFNAQTPVLQPLPINGMFYRWGVDLCGPFELSELGNLYIMVAIEHYSKHIELVPLPSKKAKHTAAAFAHAVLGRFGSCAEVLTDQGSEWQGEFAQLLQTAMIDHRQTSPAHPQADGLAERAVQTVKRSLRKLCEAKKSVTTWDTMLPWIALGYRCSPQKSTGYSPYELLYARRPTVPPAIREKLAEPVDVNNSDATANDLLRRAEWIKHNAVIAGDNLKIAQHRDTLKYARVRDGTHLPKLRKFEVGDYVYVQREVKTTIQLKARALILRIKEVRSSCVLVLQGRCGTQMAVHMTQCAPCHLPDLDGTIDPSLAAHDDAPCVVCGYPDDDHIILLCDGCGTAWHTYCCSPPLPKVPEGTWLCASCISADVDIAEVQAAQARSQAQSAQEAQRAVLHPTKATRGRDTAAAAMDGRLVVKKFNDPATGKPRNYWGRVHFRGALHRPYYHHVVFEDGETGVFTTTALRGRHFKVMPSGTALPDSRSIPEPTKDYQSTAHLTVAVVRPVLVQPPVTDASSASAQLLDLPDAWCLHESAGLSATLSALMPGNYAANHITKLANQILKVQHMCRYKETDALKNYAWVTTDSAEMQPLLCAVDFASCRSILDPFSGNGAVATGLQHLNKHVITNDINQHWAADSHADALQPAFYRQHQPQIIVSSPWFAVLDIAIPLAVHFASICVCMHVPGHYISNAHCARQQWLRALFIQDRVHVIMGLPRGPSGRRCAWLIIFASAALKQRMLRPLCATGFTVSLAN